MEKTSTHRLTVIDGDGPLPSNHPLKLMLVPVLTLVWNRDAKRPATHREAERVSA
jgi:hypothetical protein